MIRLARYAVHIEPGLLDRVGEHAARVAPAWRYAIITDDTVRALHAGRVERSFSAGTTRVYSFKPGEAHKTRKTWAALSDAMFADGLGRDTTVIALGGGVAGDLAGFVAATFARGVPVVQVPTTLLAMVDASVGGKTGVDVPAGKNLVGAFHWPAAVLADPDVLDSLPAPELRGGLAEAIKHGVIADAGYFERTTAALPRLVAAPFDRAGIAALIEGSVRIKAQIVEADERESGRRRVLNFGHTIAHALEQASSYRVPHGEAVGIGMVVEARIAELIGAAGAGLARTLAEAVRAAGLPHALPPGSDPAAVLRATRTDKKAAGGAVRYALPAAIGRMAAAEPEWSVAVPDEAVMRALAATS